MKSSIVIAGTSSWSFGLEISEIQGKTSLKPLPQGDPLLKNLTSLVPLPEKEEDGSLLFYYHLKGSHVDSTPTRPGVPDTALFGTMVPGEPIPKDERGRASILSREQRFSIVGSRKWIGESYPERLILLQIPFGEVVLATGSRTSLFAYGPDFIRFQATPGGLNILEYFHSPGEIY